MRAARVEALTPFPLASSANCLFHASKPAAVLPHCAAPALPVIHRSATKTATVTILSCPPLVIPNSFHALCITRNAGSQSPFRRAGCPSPRQGSRLGHLREHALQRGGIAIDAARLQ